MILATGWRRSSEALTRICRMIVGPAAAQRRMDDRSGRRSSSSARRICPAPAARQEAVRGTYDPTYGGYFLGKVAAFKLRSDYAAARGSVSTCASSTSA